LPCAYGGSSLAQWDPAGLAKGNETLYGFMVERIRLAGGRVRGLLWFQGESDAGNPDQVAHPVYEKQFEQFIAALRRDLNAPQLPILMAQIGRFIGYDGRYAKKGTLDRSYEIVREAQRQVAGKTADVRLVSTIDLGHFDIIHLSREAQERLGKRLAFVALPYVRQGVAPRQGIELAGARFTDAQRTRVEVEFRNVNGRLRAAGEPHGFELRDKQTGEELDWVFAVELSPAAPATAVLKFDVPLRPGLELIYAPRANSYANLVDEQDLAVPAFGPVAIDAAK
jgi:sialate O-acetylesterase